MRTIDAGALIRYISKIERDDDERLFTFEEIKKMLRNAPTIEPEVRHGRWYDHIHTDTEVCSECGRVFTDETQYCPNCGARMDADHIADVSKKVGGDDNDAV